MAGKITLVDVCSNRWHHRLILVQVVINYRYKWGTEYWHCFGLDSAFQLSTDTNTVDWWYSSVWPVRGPVARKFTGSTEIYGQHVDLRVARKSTTSPPPLPDKREYDHIEQYQATVLDAWASRVKCPAKLVSHWHTILTDLTVKPLGLWNRLGTKKAPWRSVTKFHLLHRMLRDISLKDHQCANTNQYSDQITIDE